MSIIISEYSVSGRSKTIGIPLSPPILIFGLIGIPPRKGTCNSLESFFYYSLLVSPKSTVTGFSEGLVPGLIDNVFLSFK